MNTQVVADWIEDILEYVRDNYNKRKVVLWGKYGASETISALLKERYGIDTAFFIENDRQKIDNKNVYSKEKLIGGVKEYYVVVPIGYYEEIKEYLYEVCGYQAIRDCYYFCDCIKKYNEEYYEDLHGNIIRGNRKGIKIALCCYNAQITIGQNCLFTDCRMEIQSNAQITIGDNGIYKKVFFGVWEGAKLFIGNYVYIADNGRIKLNSYSQIVIGSNTTASHDIHIDTGRYAHLSIGEDCMFSWDIDVLTDDGHSIFDIVTKENINSKEEIKKIRRIDIGNHVWVGMKSIILYNTIIGDGSIVGAGSLLKKKYPNNCVIAGSPARIIRKDVAWCREDDAKDIRLCGEEYINYTQAEMK